MKITKAFLLLFLLIISMPADGQDADSVLTIIFTGDIMGHDGQIEAAYDESTKSYSYDNVFRYISPVIISADIAIGNLEVTLGGAPYKGYPQFSSPDELAASCARAGFDILTTANNHAADRGAKGISRTIRVLDSLNIRHTGTWTDSLARDTLAPLLITRKGITLALLNYTYGTNGIVVPPPAQVSYIDTNQIAYDIRRAREKGAEMVLVSVHWGTEYDTLPDTRQLKTAEFMQKNGADIIIGSHPHVLQPMTASEDSTGIVSPVIWSMGNFVSNQRQHRRDGGAIIKIGLAKKGERILITDMSYILTWVYTPVENGKRRFYILPCSEYEHNPQFFSQSSDYDKMILFMNSARRLLYRQNTGITELFSIDGIWTGMAR